MAEVADTCIMHGTQSSRNLWVLARATLASAVIILPCFWQSRVQAGDLSSHLYNTWLAGEITGRGIEGLGVVPQATNVLFDLLLKATVGAFGFHAGHKVAAALLALTLFWGAFAFTWTVARRRTWRVVPCLAILTYGWTFHMGFCNFCLAAGLSLLYLAIAWRGGTLRVALALPVLALAATAHLVPVCWAACILAYWRLARRLPEKTLPWLLGAGLLGVAAVRLLLGTLLVTRWEPGQVLFTTGADQAWIYGYKYLAVSFGLFVLWGWLLFSGRQGTAPDDRAGRICLSVAALTAFAVVVLPSSVLFPQFRHSLAYVAPRLSLLTGIVLCAAVAPRVRQRVAVAFGVLAFLYFSFLYVDSRALNRLEDDMESLLARVPPRSRVISALGESSARIDPLAHMVDRACIRRCYSYANYEPSTWQFRVRAKQANIAVLSRYEDSYAVLSGTYAVKAEDGVLLQVGARHDRPNVLELAGLGAHQVTGKTFIRILPVWWW